MISRLIVPILGVNTALYSYTSFTWAKFYCHIIKYIASVTNTSHLYGVKLCIIENLLTLLLLNTTCLVLANSVDPDQLTSACLVLANSVDPDQLASEEAN